MLNIPGLARRVRALASRPSNSNDRFRLLLSEAGYRIYAVHQDRHRYHHSMIVIHPDEPTFALLIYEREGKRIVRPWSHNLSFDKLVSRLSKLSPKEDLRLMRGGLMKSRHSDPYYWTDWLSDASKDRLQEIGIKAA